MNQPATDMTDQQLMRLAQGPQPHRFGDLIRRYRGPLLRVAQSRLGNRQLAEDVVQETFLSAFKSRHTYNHAYGFRTWLWTILLNHCRSAWRGRQRGPNLRPICENSAEPVETSGEAAPELGLMAAERREQLDRLLAELNSDQADALRLRFFGGLKFHEIAETMGCSLSTAKNRVRWGLEKLAAALARQTAAEEEREIGHEL